MMDRSIAENLITVLLPMWYASSVLARLSEYSPVSSSLGKTMGTTLGLVTSVLLTKVAIVLLYGKISNRYLERPLKNY